MNTYYNFKLTTAYIIPLCIVTLIITSALIHGVKEIIRETRIKKFFVAHGYERKFFDVENFSDTKLYRWNGWIRQTDRTKQIMGRVVNDHELVYLSLKEIKELYK
jgi:hypothetical protein